MALAFYKAGVPIRQICSRSSKHSIWLSKEVAATYTNDIAGILDDADFYLFCVPDQKIQDIKDAWQHPHKLIAHTAGTTSIDILKSFSDRYGVFYPLQTFSKDHDLSFRNLPVCIEANNNNDLILIQNLAKKLTANVRILNSAQRKVVHLSAVIASNFSNYMYVAAQEILKEEGLDFDLIHPLIMETARKAGRIGPEAAQTGPAIRNDEKTIETHLMMLQKHPEYQAFYKIITQSIISKNHSH